MDALFNAKLGYKNIESGIQDTDNLSLTNDRAITRS